MGRYTGKAAPRGAAFLFTCMIPRTWFDYLLEVVLTWSTARTILS